jgi:hypothetical protein
MKYSQAKNEKVALGEYEMHIITTLDNLNMTVLAFA